MATTSSSVILIILWAVIVCSLSSAEARNTAAETGWQQSLADVQDACRKMANESLAVCRLANWLIGATPRQQQQQQPATGSRYNALPQQQRETRSTLTGDLQMFEGGQNSFVNDLMESAALGSDAPTWTSHRLIGEWQPMRGKRTSEL